MPRSPRSRSATRVCASAHAAGNRARLVRWLSCLTLALLAFGTKSALAFPLVPMCSADGQTVLAPPVSRAASEIPLAPSGCEQQRFDPRLKSAPPHQSPPEMPSVELIPRVPPLRFRLPKEPCSRAPLAAVLDGERGAHRTSLDRPPR
ncbi:MAG: hypothetical protein QM756_38405 [Polyangiaceae bacterium]